MAEKFLFPDTIEESAQVTRIVNNWLFSEQMLRLWRGKTIPDLVCIIQKLHDLRNETGGETAIRYDVFLHSALQELNKRFRKTYPKFIHPNQGIADTIKAKVPIEDVLEWFTTVEVFQGKWKFRCKLHGEDQDPSGHIYRNENRWWCFGCNRGGDVIDAVQIYGQMEAGEAFKKLATYIGIDLDYPKVKTPIEERFEQLENDIAGLKKMAHSHPKGKKSIIYR